MQSDKEKPSLQSISKYSHGTKVLFNIWHELTLVNEVLYKISDKDIGGKVNLLVTPSNIRRYIFDQLHSNRVAGHFGRDKTVNAIKSRFYWPGLTSDVSRWCNECDLCSRRKPGPGRGKAPMKNVQSGFPLERIAIDILGPLPTSDRGHSYIMVVGDYFTKWTESYAIADHTAQTVADTLVTEFICRYGVPYCIHTDQGREFESNLFKALCKLLDIDKTRTTPYHPQSDGMIERFNRTLQQMLAMFANSNRNDWDDHLPYVMFAYRTKVQDSTKCTPSLLMFGREINVPIDILVGDPNHNGMCPIEYVQWVQAASEQAFEFAQQNLTGSFKRQKYYHDQNMKTKSIEVNSWVWRWYPPNANVKLGLGWTGPYLVIGKPSDVTVKIQKALDAPMITVHINDLKPYLGDTSRLTSWIQQDDPNRELVTIPSQIVLSNLDNDVTESPPRFNENYEDLTDNSLKVMTDHQNIKFTKTGRVTKPPIRLLEEI